MNNKKLLHYTFAGVMLTSLLLGGTYSYLSFSIENAYNNKKYDQLAKLTKQYKFIFPDSYQIAFKGLLEERLESDLKSSGKTIIDPRLDFLAFNLEEYMTRQTIEESSEKWVQFYKELEKHTSFNDFKNSSEFNNTPIVSFYPLLATKASQINFNNKKYFLNSCYNFKLAITISEIPHMIGKYINNNDILGFSHDDLANWSKLKIESVNTTIKALNKMKNKHISKEYYEELEIIFYETITANHKFYHNLTHNTDKKTLKSINKSLFSGMETYSSNRAASFPRSDKEIEHYHLLKSLLQTYD